MNSENCIFSAKIGETDEIAFISIDLLLRKIAFEDLFEFKRPISNYIFYQFHIFSTFDIFFEKVKNLFYYYTKKKSKNFLIILDFPRGIITFLNKFAIYRKVSTDILFNDNLIEFQKFYDLIKNYPEALEHELLIKEIIFVLEIRLKISLNNDTQWKYYNCNDFKIAKLSILPEKTSKIFDILEWSEVEIARQITLITHFIFIKIGIKELVTSNWTKEDKYILAPNIMKMIQRYDNLSFWICEEILSYDHKDTRAKAIIKFLKIAKVCQIFNNFNDCVNIVISLDSFRIKSLKKTWKIALKDREIANLHKGLNSLCSFNNNYAQLRKEISSAQGQPCVPFFALYLKDLSFLDEGPRYINEKNLINIQKIRKVGEKLEEIIEFQARSYIYLPLAKLSFLAEPKPKKKEILDYMSGKLGII